MQRQLSDNLESCSNISFYLLPPIGESWIKTWLPVGVISWVKTCEHKRFIKLSYIFTVKMFFLFLFQTHAHYWSVQRQKNEKLFFFVFFKVCIIFIVYHLGCGLNKLDFSFWHKSKNNLVIQGTTKYLWWRMFCFNDDIFYFLGRKLEILLLNQRASQRTTRLSPPHNDEPNNHIWVTRLCLCSGIKNPDEANYTSDLIFW